MSCSPRGLSAGVIPVSSPSKTQCPHGASGWPLSGLLPFQTGHRDDLFSKNLSCSYKKADFPAHTQKADFPICLEVAFGPQPRESQGARRHSGECPRQPSCSPAREEGSPLRICRGRCPQTARLGSGPGPPPLLVGLALLGRPPSAALATSDPRSPPPRPAVPAPHREPVWIVAVCLCLLKLGREKRPRREDGLECTTDGSVSKLRKRAGGAGTRPRSGAAWLAQNTPSERGNRGVAARTEVSSVRRPSCV